MKKNITIAICCLGNAYNPIADRTDKYLIQNYDVIVVSDKNPSIDGCLHLKSKGNLPADRQQALDNCKTKYIFYIANKTVIEYNLKYMLEEIKIKKWVGGALQIWSKSDNLYLKNCINTRYINKLYAGEKSNIGTPALWETKLLKKYGWNEKAGYSDDTDLSERVIKDGYKIGITHAFCNENITLKSLIYRFIMYGKSDRTYYNNHKSQWSLKRKIKSLLHPITSEWIPQIYYLPFYLFIVILRIYGALICKK